MKNPIALLKTALVTGLVIVLPAWLAVLLMVKLDGLVKPLATQLPSSINHPQLVAAAAFMLIYLAVGLSHRSPNTHKLP